MSGYTFSDALGYNQEQLSAMHNASFQGYFAPVEMTAATSADFWRVNQIDAARCVVMHDEQGTFVGMARMGTRGKRGWCGGFGIVPEFRGTGASRLLASRMVQVAQSSGLETLQLEVLAENERARKLYERIGFALTRRLVGLELASAALPHDTPVQVESVPIEALLLACATGPRPAWGNELASLLAMDVQAFVLPASAGKANGLVALRANGRLRVVAALLQSDVTAPEVAALLKQAAGDAQTILVYNEVEGSLFLEVCRQLGFGPWFNQYEMLLHL